MTTTNRPKTRRPTHKQLERELVERCDQWGYPLNGQEPWSVPYGFADAEVGTEDWAYWRHLELRNKTPLRYGGDNFELEQLGKRFARQFHDALDLGFWKMTKAPNGESWKCFEDYLKFESPWGLGVGDNWDDVLKPLLGRLDPSLEAWQRAIKTEGDYVGIVDRIAAERLQDGRKESHEFRGNQHTESGNSLGTEGISDRSDHNKLERERALNRAPAFVRALFTQGHMSLELATRFGPYVPMKPSEAQRQRADAVAAAAADVERWVMETERPTDAKAVSNYRKQLKAVASQSLGRTTQGFKVYSYDPGKVADQLIKHLPKKTQIELVNELVRRLQAGGEA